MTSITEIVDEQQDIRGTSAHYIGISCNEVNCGAKLIRQTLKPAEKPWYGRAKTVVLFDPCAYDIAQNYDDDDDF